MSDALTVRLDPDLAEWLERKSEESGLSQGEIVREQLRKAKSAGKGEKAFMKLAGTLEGPRDLSRRKGYSRG
jgi:hypothetical protein